MVATDSYFAFLKDAGIEATIRLALDDLDYNDSANLMRRAEAIKTTIEQAPMPPGIAEDIREAYRQLGEGPVAVRSSATAEDMAEASFAGQQSTFLNVVGEDNVVKAVQACWASLFEARAIFYRYENHFDNLSVGIAVPVQRMVQSERSGVMFTVEPVTSDRSKIVIEAIWGLGEGIVSGEVTPDLYVMRKDPLTIENRHIADQPQELIRNSAGSGAHEGANVWSPVPEHLRQEQKLSDSHIRELATIGLNVERHYGWPQDIEWAWEGGQFFLVQTRPVTTITEHGTEAAETGRETARVLLQGLRRRARRRIGAGAHRAQPDGDRPRAAGRCSRLRNDHPGLCARHEARRRHHHRSRWAHLPRRHRQPGAGHPLRRRLQQRHP